MKYCFKLICFFCMWEGDMEPDLLKACASTKPLLVLKNYGQGLEARSETLVMKGRGQLFLRLNLLHMHL